VAAAPLPAAPRKRSSRGLGIVAGLLAALTVAGVAGAVMLSTVFFIGVDDGRLAVYSGVPAEIGPVNLHAVYRRSVRTYDSLTDEERRIVDAQALRGRSDVLDVSEQLEMWP
jgi:protein phosphatase